MTYRFIPVTTPEPATVPARRKVNRVLVRRIVVAVLLILSGVFGGLGGVVFTAVMCILWGRHMIKSARRKARVERQIAARIAATVVIDPRHPYDGM